MIHLFSTKNQYKQCIQVAFLNQPKNKRKLNLEESLALVKDAFYSCCERDIYTGDSVVVYIITKDGAREERFDLKKD